MLLMFYEISEHMKIHRTINSIRIALSSRLRDSQVALVPTMGNLHSGHIALMGEARSSADVVVASIFVNRLQFRPGEDFDQYPRTFDADCTALELANVDHLFSPEETEIYPRAQSYFIEPPPEQSTVLEGAFRPGHFRGVATIVNKLFNIIQPNLAFFGKKDFQQFLIIKSMVRELNLPIKIIASETRRDKDGLALSSRNGYLSQAQRVKAPLLHQILSEIVSSIRLGHKNFTELEKAGMNQLRNANWNPDYVAIRNKISLECQTEPSSSLVVLAAARLGSTRLIDNLEV